MTTETTKFTIQLDFEIEPFTQFNKRKDKKLSITLIKSNTEEKLCLGAIFTEEHKARQEKLPIYETRIKDMISRLLFSRHIVDKLDKICPTKSIIDLIRDELLKENK